MDQQPSTSVIIVVKNGAPHIGRQLDALARQVDAPTFEVIISDNGSTDGTRDVVHRWAAEQRPAFELRVVDAGAKPGISFAKNTAARVAKGSVFAFCDSDDEVSERWVSIAHSSITPTVDAVGGRAVVAEGSGRDQLPEGLWSFGYLPFALGGSFAVSREAYFDIGGFDESLPPYGFEDVDVSWRIQEAGYALAYEHDLWITFIPTPRSRVVRKEFLSSKARVALAQRHPHFVDRPYSLGYCVRDLATHAALLPIRLLRPRHSRIREVKWLVDSAGRLAGYWHYYTLKRDSLPVLLREPQLGEAI
ncbi:glycosyltransferase family 2 protein [Tessaracoccus palaemonis]|uniref:Glycosyltransferase family 2 protein n=1 Tax=Tessaracoccus palaemonis TaxID=2829499 RepID=A0ABX8SH02_9ACTN|nr:glycosyltransferase family A protein [Tessaracoccus palaemonis]QXT61960.1 glycosyltransferase family 2 protein [Tessaracoccus palaemonis]